LTCGDFNGDGFDDLAIGVPREDFSAVDDGAAHVLYGSIGVGIQTVSPSEQFFSQDTPGILGLAQTGDGFGFSLMGSNYDGDEFDDLAIGVPFEDINGDVDAGAVNVIYGSASGIVIGGNQFWHQDSSGINGATQAMDNFALALTAGDFDGNGVFDLAIGVPLEDLFGFVDTGAVNVIYGVGGVGLQTAAPVDQLWYQNQPGIIGANQAGDIFGTSLLACDYNGDGFFDLAIGVTHKDLVAGTRIDAGATNVLYGGGAIGLQTAVPLSQFWHQDSPGVNGAVQSGDNFGIASTYSTLVHPLP